MNTEPDIASTSRQPARPVRPVQRVHGNTSDVESREAFWTPVYPVRLQNASSDGDASIRVRNTAPTGSGRTVWDEIITVLRKGNEEMARRLAEKEEDVEALRRQNRQLYYRCQELEDERRHAQERHARALADQRAEISQLEQRLVDAEAETSRLNEENRRLQDAARDRERPTTSSTTETGQLLQVATELERIANDQKDAIKLAEKEAERVAARLRESVDECDRLRRSADRLTRDLAESKRESARTIEGQANALKLVSKRKDDAERELNDLKLRLNESSKRLREKRCVRCTDSSDASERLEHLQWDYDESVKNVYELMDRLHAKDQKIDELERLVEILREQFRTAGIPMADHQASTAEGLTTRTTLDGTPPPSTSREISWTRGSPECSLSTRIRPARPDSSEPHRKKRALRSEDVIRQSEALPARPYDDGPPDLTRESAQGGEGGEPSLVQEGTAREEPDIVVIEADPDVTKAIEPHGSTAQIVAGPHIRLVGPPAPRALISGVPAPPVGPLVLPYTLLVPSTDPPTEGASSPLADSHGPSVGACLTALLAPQQTRSLPAPRQAPRRPRRPAPSTTAAGPSLRRRAAPPLQNAQWRDVQLLPISTNPPVFYLVDERRFVEVYTDPATGEQMTRNADPLALQAMLHQQQQASEEPTLQPQPRASPSTSARRRRTRDDAVASTSGTPSMVASQMRVPGSTQRVAQSRPVPPLLPDAVVDPLQFAQAMNASTAALPTTSDRANAVSSGTRPPTSSIGSGAPGRTNRREQ